MRKFIVGFVLVLGGLMAARMADAAPVMPASMAVQASQTQVAPDHSTELARYWHRRRYHRRYYRR